MPKRRTMGPKPATRSSRTKLLDDPGQRERELNEQLKSMSMYASHTSGDGNCLFRALSDQFHGTPDHHARLRHEICDYLAASPDRYAGFVDIEKPFEDYVKTMRQNGTYGGHLELSAFASLKKKEIKIVQPGLVYVVSGDDDSRDAVIERQAIEQERQRIQDSLPPPSTEELSLSSREARRKKRTARQANTRESSEEPGAAAASGSRSAANSPAPLLPKNGVVEAFGPLYIAYHNWEHYSSVRNVAGPHSGLPRIIERNVSLAAQRSPSSKGKGRRSDEDDEDEEYVKPTEHEELILRSVPGHTLPEVRFLLKQHGNLWESVVEVLIAKDAAADPSGANGNGLGSSPPGALTRSRAPSSSYRSAGSPRQANSTPQHPTASSSSTSSPKPPLAVPDYLKSSHLAWRGSSPSASSSGGDATSASGHGPSPTASAEDTTGHLQGATSNDYGTGLRAPQGDLGPDGRPFSRGSQMSGIKRAASKDLVPLHGDERSPKRRSSSRERERDEKIVDGVLASRFESAASTHVEDDDTDRNGVKSPSSSPEHLQDFASPYSAANTPGRSNDDEAETSSQQTLSQASPAKPLNLEDESLASYYSTRRRALSPPLTSDAIATMRSDRSNMSAKDKRDWELKRKRDRQRERRAMARSQKGGKASETASPAPSRKSNSASTRETGLSKSALAARSRREQRARQDDEQKQSSSGASGTAPPKGFVELKI